MHVELGLDRVLGLNRVLGLDGVLKESRATFFAFSGLFLPDIRFPCTRGQSLRATIYSLVLLLQVD